MGKIGDGFKLHFQRLILADDLKAVESSATPDIGHPSHIC
jgi:hypothetical protein